MSNETKPTHTNRDREMTMKDRCFTVDADGFISDNNFDFDAGMRVSGDFVGDEKRRYAEMIAAVLNAHAHPVNARLLEALKTLRDALRDHPEYAQLSEEQEEETGGDTAEFSYLVRVADEAIATAEAVPKAVRLTAYEQRLICDRYADIDGTTGQTGRAVLARAIETAVLRKNGIEVTE